MITPRRFLANALLALAFASHSFSVSAQIPPLPAASACNLRDLNPGSLWVLVNVFEDPRGAEMAAVAVQPYQYFHFDQHNVYYAFLSSAPTEKRGDIVNAAKAGAADGLRQININENGVLFFYKDGVSIDAMGCLISQADGGAFLKGDMLLIPPNQQPAKLVKVYRRWGIYLRTRTQAPSMFNAGAAR